MPSISYVLLMFLLLPSILFGQDEFEKRKYTKEDKLARALAVEFNTGIGILDVENETTAGIQAFYGATFKKKFTVGLGTGIHLYDDDRFLPLFAEGRYYLGSGDTRFMLGTSLGAYRALDQNEWEQYINPFIGFTYKAFDHVALSISLGLIYKDYDIRLEPVRQPNGTFTNLAGTEEVVGRFIALRFGCLF